MLILFAILVIIASVVLGFFVLIQNPKGGGLSSGFGGFGNQLMGVKQTTDVLEKGTWIFAAIVAILCILSPAFLPKQGTSTQNQELFQGQAPKQANPANTAPMTTTPQDSNKAK